MKTPFLLLLFFAGCVAESERSDLERTPVSLSIESVERLVRQGVSEDVIIAQLRSEGIDRHPTADELVRLKNEGLSDRLIEEIVSARVPSPERTRVIDREDSYPPWYYDYEWNPHGYPHWYWEGWWVPYPVWRRHWRPWP